MSYGRILVIGDDPSDSEALVGLLDGEYDLQVSGTEALREGSLDFSGYDMIILDLQTPVFKMARLVVKQLAEVRLWIPVMCLTWEADSEEELQLLDYGIIDYISKPAVGHYLTIRIAQLIKIKAALSGRDYRAIGAVYRLPVEDFKNSRIAIVDDNAMDSSVIEDAFSGLFEVRCYQGGVGALEDVRLGRFRPDLVLLDIQLEDLSGYQILEQLKSMSDTREIPVIFFSAKTRMSHVIKGLQLGADDYFSKPLNHKIILKRSLHHLKTSRVLDSEGP